MLKRVKIKISKISPLKKKLRHLRYEKEIFHKHHVHFLLRVAFALGEEGVLSECSIWNCMTWYPVD